MSFLVNNSAYLIVIVLDIVQNLYLTVKPC